jgi:hypothetical protein
MDSYREYPSDFENPAAEAQPDREVALSSGGDERRMHVRAYNYWVSLLEGRDFPSIEDLEPHDLTDFSRHSVLLDFTCGRDNPATPYIGSAIREECGLSDEIRTISEVPSRSLLSRLTDHYMQIIANRAPVGFEAEFENQRGEAICYRGILMPFSSDGDTIDFIYGVINWKHGENGPGEQAIVPPVEVKSSPLAQDVVESAAAQPAVQAPVPEDVESRFASLASMRKPVGGFAPVLEEAELQPSLEPEPIEQAVDAFSSPAEDQLPPAAEESDPNGQPATLISIPGFEDLAEVGEDEIPTIELGEDAELADRLWAARETAEAVKSADGRSRAALYNALSLAYDFAVAAQSHPDEYQELLQDSGVKAQARAPMTPIVKLVFGIDYDKTRLTEFASALSYARRQQVDLGGFGKFIERQPGGLKALVAAERQAKRPEPRPDTKLEAALGRLRSADSIPLSGLGADSEFAVVITRRNADGVHEVVALVDDEAFVEKAIRRLS